MQDCAYSPKCDVYSLGVLLYVMLVGYPPYEGNDTNSILRFTVYVTLVGADSQKWDH